MELQDLILLQNQLREDLGATINKYNRLPACMIEPVLNDYHIQITNIQAEQLNSAKEYIKKREEQKKDKKKEVKDEQRQQ